MRSQCKNCGTEFAVGEEPWLKQQEHCTRHDVVHVFGTECTSCAAERDDSLAKRTAESDKPLSSEEQAEAEIGRAHV